MLKKIILFITVFLLSSLTILDIKSNITYGLIDYFNIMFCNTETYHFYNRTNYNIINMLFFLSTLNLGIYYISERLYTHNNSFKTLTIIRYNNYKTYFNKLEREYFLNSFKYLSTIVFIIMTGLILFERESTLKLSAFSEVSIFFLLCMIIIYFIKLLLLFNVFEVLMTLLILTLRFEFMILIFMVIISLILFLDITFKVHFVTYSDKISQIYYMCAYYIIYIVSSYFVKYKYKKMELV